MKITRILIALLYILFLSTKVFSTNQDSTSSIKPYIISFSNICYYHQNDSIKFEQDKLLFGINFRMSRSVSGKFGVDFVRYDRNNMPGTLTPKIKPACISYLGSRFRIDAGIFFNSNWQYQFPKWGLRHVKKIYLDEYKFIPSADLGIRFSSRINKIISYDFALMNGKGFKDVTPQKPILFSASVNIGCEENILFRLYSDVSSGNTVQYSLFSLLCYQREDFGANIEYNIKKIINTKKEIIFTVFQHI